MVELLVSIALLSVMTAVLLQSFIVARRLNARASTEQRLQALAENTMESLRAADLNLTELAEIADSGGIWQLGDVRFSVAEDDGVFRLVYNDIGNGRGPVVSFGTQYGVICEVDTTPYNARARLTARDKRDLVESYNSRVSAAGRGERLAQIRVVVYRMESRLAKDGAEILRYETAERVRVGGNG